MKCQCCKGQEVEWSWQPFGPGIGTEVVFTLPGSHYRGYPVIKVCSDCKAIIQHGTAPVHFTYKGTRYTAANYGADAVVATEPEPQRPTAAQQRILDAMEQEQCELSEIVHIVAGNVDRRTGQLMPAGRRLVRLNSGRKPVQVTTIDALLTQKRIAECGRYRYSEGTEQGKPYEAWHIDYRLANPVTVQQ